MLGRREFLLAGGVALLPRDRTRAGVVLHDPENALAEESWRGYRRCLDFTSASRIVIVPAFRILTPQQWLTLREEAGAGACIVLESGLAFASDAEIEGQRAGLRRYFGIRIAPELSRPAARTVRYIRYAWPSDLLVREFGESVGVDAAQGQAIATVNTQVVGLRKRLGLGNVVYLGSPLGPSLLAGDPQAHHWVRSVVAAFSPV